MAKTAPTTQQAQVCWDHSRRTALLIGRASGHVSIIPMAVGESFRVHRLSEQRFKEQYQEVPNYPIAKAAELFVRYALDMGCTKDAMDELAKLTPVSQSVRDLCTLKVVTTTAPDGTVTEKVVVRGESSKGGGGESAASLFQRLILEGKLTDDQIFKQVQKQFKLDDSRRSYVAWYRKKLIKDGKLKEQL